MPQRLLNIASIVCFVVCVALMGMWVRSSGRVDELRGCFPIGYGFSICSAESRLSITGFGTGEPIVNSSWSLHSIQKNDPNEKLLPKFGPSTLLALDSHWGFAVHPLFVNPSGRGYLLAVPYWFLVLTAGSLVMIVRMRWPWRLTLRGLFIATTFLAIVLGMIAWLDRAWIGK
jgi:hypothetical protein